MDGLDSAVRMLRAAGDATRLRILAGLSVRPLCVCELVSLVEVGQPAVSRHLGLLEAAGLVESCRDGRWVEYRLAVHSEAGSDADFGGALLREIRALAVRDPAARALIERAGAADRHALREAVRDRCRPEPVTDGAAAPPSRRAPAARPR
jgi:DNA-binding transcriptional ArsR family regulator